MVLRVGIENNGKADAENCKARFRLIGASPTDAKKPTGEPKPLVWEDGEKTADIPENDYGLLNVVLSDSRLWVHEGGMYGFVATETVLNNPTHVLLNEPFGIGEFDFELVVTVRGGTSVRGTFHLHIEEDYKKIVMSRTA